MAAKRRDPKAREATRPAPSPPPARPANPADGESIVWRFVAIYLLLVLVGFIVFRHPATMVGGNEMSVDRAMFTSVNAVTLTGFQQTLPLDEYRWPGKIAALLLTIGGTLTTLIAGGMAVTRITRMDIADRAVIVAACAVEAMAAVVGAVGLTGAGRGVFDAIFQGVSAFGNSGLHLGPIPPVDGARTHLVLLPLAVLGGLGVPVLLSLVTSLRRLAPLHPYVRVALVLWSGSYVVAFLVLALLGGSREWTDAMAGASVQAVNSRTVGLPFPIGEARQAQWALMVLMAVGGVSGAAAGGIKLTTLRALVTGGRTAMRGDAPGRIFGIALVWLTLYGTLVLGAVLCLLATEPGQSGDRLLFLAVSAASNVGLAHNPVSIVKGGMFVLSATMLLGRILPLAILWWVVAVADREDDVPVG